MNKKPLIETNPHLKARGQYPKALSANVASSTALETGASVDPSPVSSRRKSSQKVALAPP